MKPPLCLQADGAVESESDEEAGSGSVSLGEDSDGDVAEAAANAVGAERAISIRTGVLWPSQYDYM